MAAPLITAELTLVCSQLQVGQAALLIQNGLDVGNCSDLTLGHLLLYSPVRQPRLVIKVIKEQQ